MEGTNELNRSRDAYIKNTKGNTYSFGMTDEDWFNLGKSDAWAGKPKMSPEQDSQAASMYDLGWKGADYETYLVMIQAVGKKENDYFTSNELLNFPCTDLRTIDRLWVKYSNGRFGFSVQKQIYLEVGGKPDGNFDEVTLNKLGDRVGWKVDNNWIRYSGVTFSTSAPVGHLPGLGGELWWGGGSLLSHRDL
jgi:GUN4-like